MCGISGVLVLDGSPFRLTAPLLEAMRDSMRHRGPDGAGLWLSPDARIGLGHRRLSIIDLSPEATQPMANEDGSLRVCFNGEIYNHADIRAELERIGGHRWKTSHSDTEVILHAFEQWGTECLHRFRGMFAFALWDDHRKELWLVRDRIGIKPLYYSIHHSRLVFASEIKALLADPDQRVAIDERALFHYLSFLTTPAPSTMFAGIRKLAPGTWMKVSADGRVQTASYWDVWDHTEPLSGHDDHDLAERILSELRTAVSWRKVSDVPVGVFLSGGIDSSANAALFSEGESRPVRTFSIGYSGDDMRTHRNELSHAAFMARTIGADHHEKVLSQNDLHDFLPRMAYQQDEPNADPVCFPIYEVSRLARDNGVIVCQVGEGADELFWGYPQWKRALYLQKACGLPGAAAALRLLAVPLLERAGKGERMTVEWLRRASRNQPLFWGGAEAFTHGEKACLLSPDLLNRLGPCSSWDVIAPLRETFLAKAWNTAPLNWMTYLDLKLRLPELLLMRVDKMSMAVSLEARVPFLDHKFVELALSIPPEAKTRNGVLKSLLKKSLRGVIPDRIIDRKKQGFSVPLSDWMRRGFPDVMKAEITGLADTGLFQADALRRQVEQGNPEKTWTLYVLARWWATFIQPRKPAASV